MVCVTGSGATREERYIYYYICSLVLIPTNEKLHYYSFKMNIKVQNMCQTCLLVIRTQVCDSFIYLESVHNFSKALFILFIFLLHTIMFNYDY